MSTDEKIILLKLFEKYNSDPAVKAANAGQDVTVDGLIAISKAAAIAEVMEQLGIIPPVTNKYESRRSEK